MEKLLRRWMWVVDGAAIAVAAIFAAHAAARWISRVEIHDLPQHLIEDYVRSNEETPAKTIDAILRRHIFCSACEASVIEPPSTDCPRTTAVAPGRGHVRAATHRQAVVGRDHPGRCCDCDAAVHRRIMICDATIHFIEATRVHLRRRDGQREVLELARPAPRRR